MRSGYVSRFDQTVDCGRDFFALTHARITDDFMAGYFVIRVGFDDSISPTLHDHVLPLDAGQLRMTHAIEMQNTSCDQHHATCEDHVDRSIEVPKAHRIFGHVENPGFALIATTANEGIREGRSGPLILPMLDSEGMERTHL